MRLPRPRACRDVRRSVMENRRGLFYGKHAAAEKHRPREQRICATTPHRARCPAPADGDVMGRSSHLGAPAMCRPRDSHSASAFRAHYGAGARGAHRSMVRLVSAVPPREGRARRTRRRRRSRRNPSGVSDARGGRHHRRARGRGTTERPSCAPRRLVPVEHQAGGQLVPTVDRTRGKRAASSDTRVSREKGRRPKSSHRRCRSNRRSRKHAHPNREPGSSRRDAPEC